MEKCVQYHKDKGRWCGYSYGIKHIYTDDFKPKRDVRKPTDEVTYVELDDVIEQTDESHVEPNDLTNPTDESHVEPNNRRMSHMLCNDVTEP